MKEWKERLTELCSERIETLDGIMFEKIMPEPPSILYHYTNFNGMDGIIKSKSFWLTYYKYLNDSSEIVYACDLIKKMLQEKLKENSEGVIGRVLSHLINSSPYVTGGAYIACLCDDSDSLNQWRDYADGNGYALGFRVSDIIHELPEGAVFRKVIYDLDTQRELIEGVLNSIVDAIQKLEDEFGVESLMSHADSIIPIMSRYSRAALAEYLYCFKSQHFHIEKEWRIICLGFNSYEVKYRNGVYGITPYIEIPIAPSYTNHSGWLPLKYVTVGPTEYEELAISSLGGYLSKAGFVLIDLFNSKATIRRKQ